jgi:hypothetical protein
MVVLEMPRASLHNFEASQIKKPFPFCYICVTMKMFLSVHKLYKFVTMVGKIAIIILDIIPRPVLFKNTTFQIIQSPKRRGFKQKQGARGSVVVKALCYKLEGRGFDTR